MKKLLFLSCATALLVSCGGSKLPPPSPLVDFPSSAKVTKVWSTHATDGNDDLLFQLTPVADNNVLYTVGYEGEVTAINLTNGKKIWQQDYEDLHFSSNVAVTSAFLYLGTDNAQVVKLDKTTGQLIWKKSVPSTVIAAPEATDHEVFVKTIDGEITALDTTDGKAIWNYQQTPPSLILRDTSDPVINGKTLFVGFANGALIAFDRNSGNVLWNKQINLPEGKTDVERMTDVAATPTLAGDTVYAATYQGKLVAFEQQHHDENMWSIDISTYNNFALSAKTIFLGDNQGNVIAIDKQTGTILWKQTALMYRYLTAPTYLENDLVAVGDKEGYVHILNAKDGHFVARISVNSSGILTAPLYVNGMMIIQANDGKVYAYHII